MQETKFAEGKVPKDIACVEGFESFWAFSKDKTGYSGVLPLLQLQYPIIADLLLLESTAGVVSYVVGSFSPVAAEADSLESLDGNEQLNREGRCSPSAPRTVSKTLL